MVLDRPFLLKSSEFMLSCHIGLGEIDIAAKGPALHAMGVLGVVVLVALLVMGKSHDVHGVVVGRCEVVEEFRP